MSSRSLAALFTLRGTSQVAQLWRNTVKKTVYVRVLSTVTLKLFFKCVGGKNIYIYISVEIMSFCLNKCFSSNALLFATSDTHKARNAHTNWRCALTGLYLRNRAALRLKNGLSKYFNEACGCKCTAHFSHTRAQTLNADTHTQMHTHLQTTYACIYAVEIVLSGCQDLNTWNGFTCTQNTHTSS